MWIKDEGGSLKLQNLFDGATIHGKKKKYFRRSDDKEGNGEEDPDYYETNLTKDWSH